MVVKPLNIWSDWLFIIVSVDKMAEINERASTSVDCPLSPSSTVSEEIRYLSGDAFDKISAYVQGQVDSEFIDVVCW